MQINLSVLAIAIGIILAAPQAYGLLKPAAYGSAARSFPRSLPWGYALTLLATIWFLWNLSQESVADFAAFKNVLFAGFAAVGLGTCIFVQDFLAVRGLALVLMLLAKLMVDTGRPHLMHGPAVLVFQALAYVFVIAGMWLTVSPWRLRDWLNWKTATEQRVKLCCALGLAVGLTVAVLGILKYR